MIEEIKAILSKGETEIYALDESHFSTEPLNQRTPGKGIAIILDNASIHKSKKTKMFLRRHQNIHLFYLPPYSPEYNPVEIFWHWIKPKVYGFSALGGISQLVFRFRKHVWHYNKKTLPNTISLNFNAYAKIL